MSSGVLVAAALAALALIVWVVGLVRRDRLYVGYGVILVVVAAGGVAMLTTPGALRAIVRFTGVETQGLIVLVVAFLVLMLVYTLSQMTLISNRLTAVVQEIAIKEALSFRERGDI